MIHSLCSSMNVDYEMLLEAIADPEHPKHDEMLEWVRDDFDPKSFDLSEVNALLRAYHD